MGEDALQQAHERRIGGDYEPAIELYRELLEEDASLAEALWGLGLCLMNIGEFDEALATLDSAVQAEPDSQQFLLDAGKHYTMLGMYDEARPYFDKVIELNPDSQLAGEAQKQLSYY